MSTIECKAGQQPLPVAALNGCKKHGNCIWALCDCHPTFYGCVIVDDEIMYWRGEFTEYSAALTWANTIGKNVTRD